jgi:hypothetical protein
MPQYVTYLKTVNIVALLVVIKLQSSKTTVIQILFSVREKSTFRYILI